MLPVSFLRQLIGMYGNSMQAMMPSYLEAAMTNFSENQSKIREAFEKGIANSPIVKIHETNMAMMRAATEAFIPGAALAMRSEEHTSELQSLMRITYAVLCLNIKHLKNTYSLTSI